MNNDNRAFSQNHHIILLKPTFDREEWLEPYKKRMQELAELPKGWDGYEAEAIPLQQCSYALFVLQTVCNEDSPIADIVPGANGTLQIEWHVKNFNIEIHIIKHDHVNVAIYRDEDEEIKENVIANSDFFDLKNQINEIFSTPYYAQTAA